LEFVMKTKSFLSLAAIFAIVFAFFACSSESPSGGGQQGGEPSSNSSGGSEMVSCKLNSGTCSQMTRSACMEWVNAGEAQIVSSCNAEPPPTPSSSSSTPPSSSSNNPKCGGNEYNPSAYFCSGNTIVAKCGGNEYNPSTQFCSGTTVYTKCGGNEYNPSTHFCSGTTPVAKCGSKEYDPATQECTNNVVISYFTDTRDNKRYKTVDIGTQTWMAENLNYTPATPNSPSGVSMKSKCPNENNNNCAKHGRQYDWATAMELASSYNKTLFGMQNANKKGVCPTGWHIPSDAEWQTLATSIGVNPGTKLKATSDWPSGANGTDNFGFAALPSGYIQYGLVNDVGKEFGTIGLWWSATEYDKDYAYDIMMNNTSDVYRHGTASKDYSNTKNDMLSVRCIKD